MTQRHEVTAGARTAGHTLTTLPGPRGWPLVGNLFQLTVTQLPTILEQWADIYGPLYTFRLGRKPVVVLAAPDLIQAVPASAPRPFGAWTSLLGSWRISGATACLRPKARPGAASGGWSCRP